VSALTPLLWLLTGFAWISFGVLVWAAFEVPRITALSERTLIAFLIALLGTVASLLRYNADTGLSLFPQSTAVLIFVLVILAVLLVPTAWLFLFVLGRLGDEAS